MNRVKIGKWKKCWSWIEDDSLCPRLCLSLTSGTLELSDICLGFWWVSVGIESLP